MVAVAGMHRSGTSCVAGLLERCGYKLGRQGFIGQISGFDGQPKFDNEKGHFENVDVVVINSLILREAGGEWDNLPPQNKIIEAGLKFVGYMKKFNDLFDGDLFKDPRTSLTIALWQRLVREYPGWFYP